MKIHSINIWFDKEQRADRTNSLILSINDSNADIVCMQEVIPSVYEKIKRELPKYKYKYPEQLDQSYDCVIISKMPIIWCTTFIYPCSTMGRKLICIEVIDTLSQLPIIICNTHFESEFIPPKNNVQSNKKKIIQFNYANEIMESFNTSDYAPHAIIFCADTNVQSYEEKYFFTKRWTDAYLDSDQLENNKFTYDYMTNDHLQKKNITFRGRVDRILYNKNIKLKKFKLLKNVDGYVQPSDHHAIFIDIKII